MRLFSLRIIFDLRKSAGKLVQFFKNISYLKRSLVHGSTKILIYQLILCII